MVRFLVKRFNFTDEEARDLAQDVFVSVFRHMERTKVVAMWPYLKTAALNHGRNEIRRRSIRRKSAAGSVEDMPELAEAVLRDIWTDEAPPSPETETVQKEQRQLLRNAIQSLSPALRAATLLRMQGKPYDEIAAILGITINAVKTRLRDAKQLLHDRLRDGGG